MAVEHLRSAHRREHYRTGRHRLRAPLSRKIRARAMFWIVAGCALAYLTLAGRENWEL
jgi:hypothetical protein